MQSTNKNRPVIGIACGGTGGHFLPGLSIAREFKRRGITPVLFIGGQDPSEKILTAQELGIAAVASPTVRIPGNKLKWPLALVRMLQCIQRNKALLREHGITAALGMGSFASVPMALAASSLHLPLFIHEGNAVMGRANRWLSKRAGIIFLSLPLRGGESTHARQVVVGMPVRGQLRRAARQPLSDAHRDVLRKSLGLLPDKPVLLVFGGSQGARFINRLMTETLPLLDQHRRDFQVIHLTGSKHNDAYDLAYKQMSVKALVKKSERAMQRLYQAADLVLCRAGASTIFELALFGKPAILVPYPDALDNHQQANADTLMDAEAAISIQERLLKPAHLADLLLGWCYEPGKFDMLAEHIRGFAAPQAASMVVKTILDELGVPVCPDEELPPEDEETTCCDADDESRGDADCEQAPTTSRN